MYHCLIHFYFVGTNREFLDIVKAMTPLENFTHCFEESAEPQKTLTRAADVIFADLTELSAEDIKASLRPLISDKREATELIVLSCKNRMPELQEFFPHISDIWNAPMSEEEAGFRFLRWQQHYKTLKDYRQTSHYLETTINSVPNLIWYKTKDGIHEKVNDSFCQTVGKTKQQVEGRGHAYIWNVPEDDPACIKSDNEVMLKGETCVSEEEINTGEGKRLLTTYKSPLRDIDGTVMGTVGVAIDITREHEYKEELTKKNRTLEKIFTSIDCGVMTHSLDGSKIFSINSAALKILGYGSVDELIASGFDMVADSVVDADKSKLREHIRSLKNEGDTVSVEYRVRHSDGKLLHIMGNVKLLKENGELFYQRFLLDCTAQKMQEEANERQQMELIHALSTDYSLVCFFDLDTGKGNSLRINDCKKHVLSNDFTGELSLEENFGRYISECVYEEDREMMRGICSLENIIKELSDKYTFYMNYRTNCCGELKYFQMKAVRTGDWNINRCAVLGFRSVDEEIRKEMEKKELLENALMQANRANRAKSVFLSNMSHDIRTPMNAIIGFTTLAISHIDNKERVETYLEKIMSSGNHLLSLINDVLDMSRIESGKMHLDEKPCSLSDILHGLRNILHADVNAKQIELCIDAVDVYDEEVYCDKLRLNQVLLNLLSNAVKYTEQGGKITFRITEKQDAPEGFAVYEFIIKDNGIGMSEEFVKHIFEPFERERNTTISGIQGTGLGMAITKNIVDMMHGTIEVKSKQNIGTECKVMFTFRLNSSKKEPQELPEFRNCRALVVDDDFNTCDSVTFMLQQLGMRAEWTLSGKEAILRTRQALMRNDNYGVYIVDCFLPDLNGIEVVRRIRREIGKNVSIIVLTAYDWTEIEEEAREAGVSAFCSKPLFMSELKSCLSEIAHSETKNDNAGSQNAEKIRSGRILLAEDNELNQEIAEALLTEAGFEIEIANNGKEAVNMLKNSKPEYYKLILMDVQMPVMNGYEATREIRALEDKALASIPILAMTANAFEEDKQEAINSGMNGHIAKPIDIESLLSTLDKM